MRGTWLSRIPIWNLVKLKVKKHSDLTDVTANQHHTKYTNGEAVAAMGAKGDANPLHHDKAVEAVGEGHITILPLSYDSIGQGTWAITLNVSSVIQGWLSNTTAADGDNISFKAYLDAGTYTLLMVTVKSATGGIIDIDIDAAEVASFDIYASPIAWNYRAIQTGIVISTAGLKELKLRVDGKNASSSDYYGRFFVIALWRTA